MKKVRILGAGISGLLCAYYAFKKGYQVEVYDTASQAGGKIRTHQGTHGLMEAAANAILADAEVEAVAKDIGLHLIAKKTEAKARYIYFDQKVQRWPLSFKETLRGVGFLFFWKTGLKRVSPQKQETLQLWSDRTFGKKTTRALLTPACLGIFGVDASLLSAELIYNYFFSKRNKVYGKLRGSVAPEKGMGEWIEALERFLQKQGVRFFYEKPAPPDLREGEQLIVAADLNNAIQILKSFQDPRAICLEKVSCVSLVSVNAFYENRPTLQQPGFGVLFARDEGIDPLGVLFNSDIFSGRVQKGFSETWIFGSLQKDLTTKTEDHFLSQIKTARQKIWQDTSSPIEFRINAWPEAIPLYGLELEKALATMPPGHRHVHLMGNYLGEIGLNRLFHRAQNLINLLSEPIIR